MARRGRSRLWLGDRLWWLPIVEFQPSGWSKGSYLNVAAMWLWHPSDHFAFNECERLNGFVPFTDTNAFTAAADELGKLAAAATLENFARFSSVARVSSHLSAKADGNPWDHYHAMMSALALGEVDAARHQQAALSAVDHPTQWCVDLKAKAQRIVRDAESSEPRAIVYQEIVRTRELLKLPVHTAEEVWRVA